MSHQKPETEHDSSVVGFALSIGLMLAIFAFAFLSAKCDAAIVHIDGGITVTSAKLFSLDVAKEPDITFDYKAGKGWEISRNWYVSKSATFMAYEGILAQIIPPYPTLTGNWPGNASLWDLWWRPDGVPVFVGVFSGDHHGWIRLAVNPDQSLTLYDWAYETEANMPIVVGHVPEPKTWVLVVSAVVFLLVLRRHRTTNTP